MKLVISLDSAEVFFFFVSGVYDFWGSQAHKSLGLLRSDFFGSYVIRFCPSYNFWCLVFRGTGASFIDETIALERK